MTQGSVFDSKPVFDWNHVPVGTVTSARRDPKTHEARDLVLTLLPAAREQLGLEEGTVELPASMVFGMRRDGVTLDRSLSELKRIGSFASLLKKK